MESHLRAIRAEVLLAEMDWVQGLARSLVRDPNLAKTSRKTHGSTRSSDLRGTRGAVRG